MSSIVLRVLVFACSVPLALPPGWCCFIALPTGKTTEVAVRTCERCKHRAEKNTPQDRPAPPTEDCPCSERSTVLLPAVTVEKADLSPEYAVLPSLPQVAQALCTTVERGSVVHPPTVQLHVFKCVWLC